MASQAATPPRPAPSQIVKALADATPSELSNRPLLGIPGVLLGAGIVTLAGRLLRLGTADLKGSLGIRYDQGAWIGMGRAAGVAGARARLQAYTLSVADGFLLVAWGCVIALLLMAMLRPSPPSFRQVGVPEKASTAKDHS